MDNVLFPGLTNGDFDDGSLDGWTVATEGNATAGVRSFTLSVSSAPEPGTLALLLLGLSGFAVRRFL